MSVNTANTNEGSDPRDDYIFVGIDAEDGHHVYRTKDESIFAIENGAVIHHFDLDGRSVNDYIDHVAEARGWESRQLYKGMGGALFNRIE